MIYTNLRSAASGALLLSALAASSAHGATLWTTAFTGADGNNRNLVVTNSDLLFTDVLTANDANLTFEDTSFTGTVFMHSGTMASGTYFSPRTNVDNPGAAAPQNGGWWQSEFRYTGGVQMVSLTAISLGVIWSNSLGNLQVGDTVVRDIVLTLDYTLDGTTWQQVAAPQTFDLTVNPGTAAEQLQDRVFSFDSPLTVNHASQDLWLRVRAENTGASAGAYVNLEGIDVQGAVVPEPGAGALLLLGAACGLSRRSRR